MKISEYIQTGELARVTRFIAFGLVGTTVDFVSFISLTILGLQPEIAKAFAYLAAISFTTLFISKFVFRVTVTLGRRVKTLLLYVLTGTLNVLAFSVMLFLGLSQNLAFLSATILAASVNYFAVRSLSLVQKH